MIFNKRLVGRIFPGHSRLLQALNQNALFLKWAKEHEDCRAFAPGGKAGPELTDFYRFVLELAAGSDQPVDLLEFGVAQGRTLRLWTEINRHPRSRFFGFDSFHGLPEDWDWAVGGLPKGTFSTGGEPPDIADRRIQYVWGLFQHSLPAFLDRFHPRSPLVVHLDCDLYSSTLYTLTRLDALLQGASVIFDEFDNLLHEFAAFQDYARSYRRAYQVLARVGFFKKAAVRVGESY
jgi:hypothetical protein